MGAPARTNIVGAGRGWKAVPGVPHLYRRGASPRLYALVRIPPAADLKGGHRSRALGTENVAEARRRLSVVVAELRADIERARREPSGHLKPAARRKSLEEEAAWWRERLASGDPQAREELAEAMEERRGEPVGEELVLGAVGPEYVYDPQREREADTIYGLATGERVSGDLHLGRFLASKSASASYESRVRRAVRALSSWLKGQPEGDNLRAVGRKCAAAFIDHLASLDRDAATVRSLVSALSSYWSWLKRRGELTGDNPWQGQDLPKARKAQDEKRRAFTDDEVRTLLSGETTRTLHDLMRLAALSGMRLNEIGRLTVADCQGGVFAVNRSKTDAGVRRVPIHPDLAALVGRRSSGREPEAQLLEELKAAPSHPDAPARKAAERFTAYRRARWAWGTVPTSGRRAAPCSTPSAGGSSRPRSEPASRPTLCPPSPAMSAKA